MESKKGKILTITSMKGGVGKTTTTMMLANIYAKCGKKVLVIDLDLYNGNLAFAYNIKIKNTIYNLCDDMVNNRLVNGISDDYVYKVSDNLSFHGLVEDDSKTNNRNTKQLVKKIRKYIEYLKNNINYKTIFYNLGDGIAVSQKKQNVFSEK